MSGTDLLDRTLTLFGVGAILMALAFPRVTAATRRARAVKFASYFVIVHVVLAASLAGRVAVRLLATAIVAGMLAEVVRAWRRIAAPRPILMAAAWAAALASFAFFAAGTAPAATAWIFIVTAAFDGMSQLVGQLVGRVPLAPTISPAKTVEGSIGGIAAAATAGAWFAPLLGVGLATALASAGAVAAAALAGDLLGSWTKRRAGLTDFSQALPGQGGIADRFGSFVSAMAVVAGFLDHLR